jgi:hypothetical protein
MRRANLNRSVLPCHEYTHDSQDLLAIEQPRLVQKVRSRRSLGPELTVVGAVEGAVTYGIGILLGKGGM